MLEAIITSKTRLRLLVKFFLNPANAAYLRGLAAEFGESSNGVRVELNRLEEAGFLNINEQGNKKLYRVNQDHPLFPDMQSIVRKYIGIDLLVDQVVGSLGDLQRVYLVGELAAGRSSELIDLLLVGKVDRMYLTKVLGKVEGIISKKVRYIIYDPEEWRESGLADQPHLLLFSSSNSEKL